MFKLDLDKVYNLINWFFLDYLLWGFSFEGRRRAWIRDCVFARSIFCDGEWKPYKEDKYPKGSEARKSFNNISLSFGG